MNVQVYSLSLSLSLDLSLSLTLSLSFQRILSPFLGKETDLEQLWRWLAAAEASRKKERSTSCYTYIRSTYNKVVVVVAYIQLS